MRSTQKTVITAAAAGAAGLAMLVGITVPSGAGPIPRLPDVTAEDLVTSVMTSKPPALDGTVQIRNGLGLPTIPGMPAQLGDTATARVWHDGERVRLSTAGAASEQTVVADGRTVWIWDSADRSVKKFNGQHGERGGPDRPDADPATIARELLTLLRASSTVTVDGTATVADRSVYTLVLRPAPSERTLLREVRVAVDAEKRLPLEVEVLAHNANEPVLKAGFTELNLRPQKDELFRFTPPPGAKITEESRPGHDETASERREWDTAAPRLVGEGWDTVIVAKADLGGIDAKSGDSREDEGTTEDPTAMLRQIAKPVSGPWGSGFVISTKVGTAIITEDGRMAAGAVPQQVLTEALGGSR